MFGRAKKKAKELPIDTEKEREYNNKITDLTLRVRDLYPYTESLPKLIEQDKKFLANKPNSSAKLEKQLAKHERDLIENPKLLLEYEKQLLELIKEKHATLQLISYAGREEGVEVRQEKLTSGTHADRMDYFQLIYIRNKENKLKSDKLRLKEKLRKENAFRNGENYTKRIEEDFAPEARMRINSAENVMLPYLEKHLNKVNKKEKASK